LALITIAPPPPTLHLLPQPPSQDFNSMPSALSKV
jgi:hypothetical protein